MAETFVWIPSLNPETETAPAVSVSRFGDGYSQRVPAGINSIVDSYNLSFNYRNDKEIADMSSFLERHGGVRWFWFQSPGGGKVKVVCQKPWRRIFVSKGVVTLICTFDQVFDI
ncbi:phage tail protein [Chromobacterium vaccinii]|nr:phage tail protein [Chromobacterium vaccinii]